MYHHQQACMDLEKATLVMAQLLQGNGVTHDLVVRHQQACLDLDKASRSLIRVLEHEVKKGLGISRSLSEQVEANKQLKMKIDELRKQLEEKDNLLTQANQRLAFLNANPTSRTQSNQVTTAAEVRHAQLNQPVLPAAITPECQGAALSPDTKSSVMPSDVQLLTIKQEDDDAEGDMCKAEPNEMHRSILRRNQKPRIAVCSDKACQHLHCPFCPLYKGDYSRVATHLQSHLKTIVKHGEFVIYTCNSRCRKDTHYHCYVCGHLSKRKNLFIGHLRNCTKAQPIAQVSTNSPAGQAGIPLPPSPSTNSPAGQACIPLHPSPSAQFSATFQSANSESPVGQTVGPLSQSSTSSDRPTFTPEETMCLDMCM